MLRLKVTPVVGLPQFTGWSQVAESTVSVSARLVVVYAISGKHAGNVGRDINEKVSDYYFQDVEQLHEFLQQLVSYAHTNECKIYFSCAVLGKNKSIFATYGGSIFLKRGEKSGRILLSDYEVKVIEGSYVVDDVYVLTTLQADQFLSEIQLKFGQGYDTDIIITSVVPGLHAQDDSSLSALVFITKDEEKNEELQQLKEEKAPIFELEEDEQFANEDKNSGDILNGNLKFETAVGNNEVAPDVTNLASVSFEVEKVRLPSFVIRVTQFFGPFLTQLAKNAHSFLLWLLRYLFAFLKKLAQNMRNIDAGKMAQSFSMEKLRILTKKHTYISETGSRKNLWKVGLVIILLLIVLGAVAYFSYSRNKEAERVQTLLTPIQAEVIAAKGFYASDPIATRQSVTTAIEKIVVLETENKKSSAIELVTDTKQDFSSYLESISGKEDIQELDIFYDLRLAKSDFIASGIDIREKTLVLYDKDMKQLLLLDHDSKRVSVRDFSEQPTLNGAVLQNNSVFILVDGVYSLSADLDSETKLTEVKKAGDSNKNAILLDAYDRYVYVVNSEKRNIYRYAQTEDGYSDPVGWMKSATGITYEDLRSMAVDGDVWLTTSDGQIKKFTSGREETLELRGLDVPFTKDIYLYTSEELQNVYVLDPSNNRVVIFDKSGNFVKELKSVSLASANGITVSESLAKIFVSSGSIIYQVDL